MYDIIGKSYYKPVCLGEIFGTEGIGEGKLKLPLFSLTHRVSRPVERELSYSESMAIRRITITQEQL